MSGLCEGGNKALMTCSWVSHGYVPLLILYLTVYLLLITLNTSDLVHRFRDCLIHVYQVRSWFENRAAFTFGRDTGDEGKPAYSWHLMLSH
jgi:hypothetical protein